MAKRKAWTDDECRAVVALYFAMLDKATAGAKYNKAAMIRATQEPQQINPGDATEPPLAARSRGSIEAKLMNCTAAHEALRPVAAARRETMNDHGYRALSNYQRSLRDVMAEALDTRERRDAVTAAQEHCA